jgi:hypothetical protein
LIRRNRSVWSSTYRRTTIARKQIDFLLVSIHVWERDPKRKTSPALKMMSVLKTIAMESS